MNQQSQTKLLLGIGAISAVLIAGYFGLDYFTATKTAKGAAAETAAPAAAAADTAATGDFASAISTATEGSTPGAALTEEDARRIGAEVARQVATEVAQSIVGGGSAVAGAGLTEEDARRIGAEEGRRVAEEVAAAAVQQALAASGASSGGSSGGLTAEEAEQIGLAAGRRAAEQVAASTARDVVRREFNSSVAAAPKPQRAEQAAAEPSTASAQPRTPAANKPRKTTTAPKGPGTDALRAWWTAPASGEFGLVYAGQAKGESAIALLFSEAPADSALNQSVKVYDSKGGLVSGNWEAATNPRLAVFRGLKPGRYTVVVEPALADSSGKSLGKTQHGPVYIS